LSSDTLSIRDIDAISEMRKAEELQKNVWGFSDLDVVPFSHLAAAKEAGGVLVGAFDGEDLIGFVYGFPGFEDGRITIHSHMAAVNPEYRNQNVGYRLKLAQRDRALGKGIKLITWTFDPLQSVNAHFNIEKLGVISDKYLVNFYGEETTSFLHSIGTDRLWVKWESETPAVPENEAVEIEIPLDINILLRENPDEARVWRAKTRKAFIDAIGSGFVVRHFRRGAKAGIYTLTR